MNLTSTAINSLRRRDIFHLFLVLMYGNGKGTRNLDGGNIRSNY